VSRDGRRSDSVAKSMSISFGRLGAIGVVWKKDRKIGVNKGT
jgi:hypothetical protein